jgi:hypothetical protein
MGGSILIGTSECASVAPRDLAVVVDPIVDAPRPCLTDSVDRRAPKPQVVEHADKPDEEGTRP